MKLSSQQQDALRSAMDQSGVAISELAEKGPVLLLFLRHFGCVFCREAASDIAHQRAEIESTGTHVVFVHMEDQTAAQSFFEKYDIKDVSHVSDPDRILYGAFGLGQASVGQLLSPLAITRGFGAFLKFGFGKPIEDPKQMPGIFLIRGDEILYSHRHNSPADRPVYVDIAKMAVSTGV